MTEHQKMVLEFHKKFGATTQTKPGLPSIDDIILRANLIHEEEREFYHAQNLVAAVDALADLMYVINGTALTFGVDLEPVFAEVHRSNMSKLWTTDEVAQYRNALGHEKVTFERIESDTDRKWIAKRGVGKVIKSPSYSPADVAKELRLQGYVE